MALLAGLALLTLSGCVSLAERQTRTLAGLGFQPVAEGWQLTLPERLSFEFNNSELSPELNGSIATATRELLAVGIDRLRVAGHSDNIGAREYNRDLSLRRADSVAAVLVASGFAKENIESRGYGAERPAADNATDEGRAQNRRVEIIVTSAALAAP